MIKEKIMKKLIMALRNLKQIYPDIIYICIGHGDEEENIKKLVKNLDLKSKSCFLKIFPMSLKILF